MSTTHGEGGDHVINGGGGGADSNLRKKEEEKEEPYLNEDMITNIIVKTPTEARINRLRYVCKPWYNLIKNDPRMALYRLLSSKSVPCLIFQTHDRRSHRYMNSGITDDEANEILNDPSFTTCFIKMGMEGLIDHEEYDLSTPFRKLCITACANGLVLAIGKPEGKLAYSTALYYVVNPIMNQRLRLPLPLGVNYYLPGPGFIFLPSTGEYKVVVVIRGDLSGQYLHILTLSGGSGSGGTGSPCNINVDDLKWRLVEATPNELSHSPLVVNEVFYWVHDTPKEDYIVSFDARTEKFYTTPHNFPPSDQACSPPL